MSVSVALIGAGATGLAMAAELSRKGVTDIRLHDINTQRIVALNKTGGVYYEGILSQGFAPVRLASTDYTEVVEGAQLIIISTTAVFHSEVARSIAPSLVDDQIVLLHPGYTGGAILFQKHLHEMNCHSNIVLAEAMNTLHLSALTNGNSVFIKAVKAWLEIATFPAHTIDRVWPMLEGLFPQFEQGDNCLQTGLNNPNPMVHVPAYLSNLGALGVRDEFISKGALFFDELLNEPVKKLVTRLDEERYKVITSLGLEYLSLEDFGERSYPLGSRLTTGIPRVGKKLLGRFVTEDVPAGLVPIASLAKLLQQPAPLTNALIYMACLVSNQDFLSHGRTAEALKLTGIPPADIKFQVKNGLGAGSV